MVRLPLRFLNREPSESHLSEAFEELDIIQVLSPYGDYRSSRDVSRYLRNELWRIYEAKKHGDIMRFAPRPWPSEDIIKLLVTKSEGYFIYAPTVTKFIYEHFSPIARPDLVLGTSNSSVSHLESNPFSELDQLHLRILSSYSTSQLRICAEAYPGIFASISFPTHPFHLTNPGSPAWAGKASTARAIIACLNRWIM